ncbi:alkylation response protein AidB-like acyl-CoA dehydrogenase [Nocardia pseudobrasiliensis]|uniref:Alkylation response protein AidB-like acyl-CoA dehydrogenase n=2 Tax=Nocardia pseudobrasiliensis TaxID=45979 RepID=A0A370I855_9NOCA|nr:alkylation response protein AidB-like acyl-CoA dehydrogenase [Nocardia pseudobrasiliensis]
MTVAMTSDLEAIATAVADGLAKNAADVDAGRTDAQDSYRIVKESGLLAALVPERFGGYGLSFSGYTRILEILGRCDGSSALGFNMHNVAIGAMCDLGDSALPKAAEDFRAWAFDEIIGQRRMFASATSEMAGGSKLSKITTTYEKTADGGYRLEGTKAFVSLSRVADYYVVAARAADSTDRSEVSHFVVHSADAGVRFGGSWDGVALNGTHTGTMILDDVRIPRSRLFMGIEGMSLFKVIREPHWMVAGYMGAYLGIARGMVDFAVDYIGRDENRRSSAAVRAELARMSIELEQTRALVFHATALLDSQRGTTEANRAVYSAKYSIGYTAPRIALDVVKLCGSAAVRKANPLERMLRESVFCSVMPAKPDECLEYVGKSLLGFNMLDAREMTW